jgi:hypothetical protein
MVPVDAVSIITAEVATFGPALLTVGGLAVAASAGVLLLRKGWGLVRSMVK